MTPVETTLNSTANLLAQAVVSYGIDLESFVDALGISLTDYMDPNGRAPVPLLQRAWAQAVEWSGDPCFGLRLADVMQPASLHGLGLAMIASRTLKEALIRMVRYQRIVSTALNIQLEEKGEDVHVYIDKQPDRGSFHDASVDATGAVLMKMCRIICGQEISPNKVDLRHSAPPCRDNFERFYGCEVVFDAAASYLTMDKRQLEAIQPNANPELARANDRIVIRYLEELGPPSVTARVRSELIEQLPDGTPLEETLAQRLNLSLRSLQRQLYQEGTGYKQILRETRFELAKRYLQESKRSITEISYLLGFAEQASFSRAFKRWNGLSPQAYRGTQPAPPEQTH